jgi:AcrR family transcriptional regulator
MPTERGPRGPYAKTAARRAEIIDAALDAFAAAGYRGASLRAIAERVGISHAGLLHHFPTKEELLAAVLERRDEIDRTRVLATAVGQPMSEALSALAAHNASNPEIVRLFTTLAAEATSEDHPAHAFFVSRYEGFRHAMARGVRTMQEAGRVRAGLDPEEAAATIGAVMDGLQLQWLLDPSVDMPATLRQFLVGYLGETAAD